MSGKTLTNAVGGVLRVAEGSNVLHYIDANLDNRGTFEVARNVNLTGSQTNSGTVSIAAGVNLNVSGSWLQASTGTVDLPAGALLNGGNWTHQGGAITGTGTLKFGSTLNWTRTSRRAGFNWKRPA